MRALLLPPLMLFAAGCPSPKSGNPAVLFLAPGDASETTVKLVDKQPGEF